MTYNVLSSLSVCLRIRTVAHSGDFLIILDVPNLLGITCMASRVLFAFGAFNFCSSSPLTVLISLPCVRLALVIFAFEGALLSSSWLTLVLSPLTVFKVTERC